MSKPLDSDPSLDKYMRRMEYAVRGIKFIDEHHQLGASPDAILENARIATTATSIEDGRTTKGPKPHPAPAGVAPCPKCGGPTWCNIEKKAAGEFKPTAPDYKCKDKDCGGVIWPPKENTQQAALEDFSNEAMETADAASYGGDDLPF
jgi:hypothetical protein